MQDEKATAAATDAMTRLSALNARFIHNFVTNDVQSHSEITHEDFVSIPSSGKRERRMGDRFGYFGRAAQSLLIERR